MAMSTPDKKSALSTFSLVILLACIVLSLVSLFVGFKSISVYDALHIVGITNQGEVDAAKQIILFEMRIPRLIAAWIVGSALGVAGAIMQIISRNPLADPGILGVNAGAAMAMIIATMVLGISSPSLYMWPVMLGSGLAALLVFFISGLGSINHSPIRLILAGAAVSALLMVSVRAFVVLSQQGLDAYRHWVVGSLEHIELTNVLQILPFFIVGLVFSIICSFSLNAIALGEDVARSLGIRVRLVKTICLLSISLLCASAVAIAGPIGFVGLVAPHIARYFCAADNRLLLFFSGLTGAGLILASDVLGRTLFVALEIQAGVMVAIIGGPFLVFVVRKMRLKL